MIKEWWIIKVKHPSLDIYTKNISLMKMNDVILVPRTRIILFSSFVIFFFYICHSGSFCIVFCILILFQMYHFYPTALKEKVCLGCISETVKCRKLIRDRDIGL